MARVSFPQSFNDEVISFLWLQSRLTNLGKTVFPDEKSSLARVSKRTTHVEVDVGQLGAHVDP